MTLRRTSRGLLLAAVIMVAALLPAAESIAAPTIRFLNPSGYSPTLRISTKQTSPTDTQYHLVAWAGETPANAFVEFEIAATPGIPGTGGDPAAIATFDGTKVGDDTFEGFLTTSTVTDGQYFLRAILYSGFTGPGTGTEVARHEISVTIQSTEPAAANTAEMTYPTTAGPLGFWRTGGQSGIATMSGFASNGTNQVRALYTLTNPGNDPTWKQCGFDRVTNGQFRVRCTLETNDNPLAVKGVAVVANQAPFPSPPQPASDQTGDAHRVMPYLQNPGRVAIDPSSSSTDVNKCTPLVATVLDQSDVPVAGINVDVHAQGPDDQLRFASRSIDATPQHSGFKNPDAEHSGVEPTAKCEQAAPDNRQGDHNVPGGPDQKHIESTSGTNNSGEFRFFLLSAQKGGTNITAWADENDDDSANSGSEAIGGAQLGWGEAPPPVATQITLDPSSASGTIDECQRFVASATQNGGAQSGKNIDIHITNPSGVGFCNPGDATVGAPDGGGHAGDLDPTPENTHHAEGTSNSSGEVIFGLTSSNEGTTNISAWLDDNNSDTQDTNESAAAGTVEWQAEGGRDISLESNKSSVRKGRQVTLSGHISASDACAESQNVKIKSRRRSGQRWKTTAASTTTNENGDYSAKVRVNETRQYRAQVGANGSCEKAKSNVVTVRAK